MSSIKDILEKSRKYTDHEYNPDDIPKNTYMHTGTRMNSGNDRNNNEDRLKNIIIWIGVIAIALVIIWQVSVYDKQFDKSRNNTIASTKESESISESETEFQWQEVSSTDLIALFKENQVKCKKLYDGKFLAVTGPVDSIGTDIADQTYVCLGSEEETVLVGIKWCTKYDYVIDQIAELKQGDIITVYGKGECDSLTYEIPRIDHIEVPDKK